MIKLCKYLSTMWNRTDSRFVAGLNNIPDRFLCKADFILSRHFTLLHNRFVKPPDWIWERFKKIILATGRDQETIKWEKRNFIPKQNTYDLLVGALSIGIPSLFNFAWWRERLCLTTSLKGFVYTLLQESSDMTPQSLTSKREKIRINLSWTFYC